MSTKIVTHHRNFHPDEIMAITLLNCYYFSKEDKTEIIRTRDENDLQAFRNDPETFVIDVGFEYNPDMLNFDHHQHDMNETWEDGTPYSSCGLIWKWLRDNKKLHQNMNEESMDAVESKLIKKVDAQDNGMAKWQEGMFLNLYNRNHDDPKVVDSQFKRALGAAKDFYINYFYFIRQEMKSKKVIEKAIKKSQDIRDVVVLDTNVKDSPAEVAQLTDKKMVVIPRTHNSWKIQTVPENHTQPFTKLCPLPEEWAGLRGEDLQKASGVEGLIFCHKDRFMCMFEGSREQAIELARMIVLKHEGHL